MSLKPLSRRTMLRGAGVALALPWLEAMWPRHRAKAGSFPVRFMTFFVPNGMYMEQWLPPNQGAGYTLSPLLNPLADLQNDFLVLSNLCNPPAYVDDAVGGGHSCGLSALLTLVHPKQTTGSDFVSGISIDQVMANALRGQTRFASLELGSADINDSSGGEVKWAIEYVRHLSWTGPTNPLPKELNARDAFNRLFTTNAQSTMPGKSVLDYVMGSTQRLQQKLGASDRQKLDSYLTSVRDVETRIGPAPTTTASASDISGDRTDLPGQVRSMLDVCALALQTNSTRVLTYMFGNGTSSPIYKFLGVDDGHHILSHHGGDPVKLAKIFTIDLWEVQQFGYFLRKLKSMQEGDGTLLDNCIVYFTSEIGDGQNHTHTDLPVIVAGRGGGAFSPGRHIRYADAPPVANLYASFFQAMGLPQATLAGQPVTPLGQLSG